MNKQLDAIAVSTVLIVALAGCAAGVPYARPAVALPAQWNGGNGAAAVSDVPVPALSDGWWREFGSSELAALMDQALAANHDLVAARERIRQARVTAGMARSGALPVAAMSMNASGNPDIGGISRQMGLNVSYEPDLWGAKAAGSQAAELRLQASVYQRDIAVLMLQADVASHYFSALALKQRLAIARVNLDAARRVLALIESRFGKGRGTRLEVAQQRTAVFGMEAQIPQLEQQLAASQSALAILLARLPQDFAIEGDSLAQLRIPPVAAYAPPALLERRPDIRLAETQLAAAHADVGAARAALYPGLNLSAGAAAAGVFSGGPIVKSLAMSLAYTIFDGGKAQGGIVLAESRRADLVEQYLKSVLTSLKEVQDGLGEVKSSQAQQRAAEQASVEAQRTHAIASARYRAGAQDLLTLLDSQRSRLQNEESVIQATLARLAAAVNLYRALGGGWDGAAVGE